MPSEPSYHISSGLSAGAAKRGTCEQWIKEGKGVIKWTRLSCRTFAANAVRLQLHALAYNLGSERAKERVLGPCSSQNPDKIQVITARNPAGQTRLTHDREGQPHAGAKGGGASASSIVEEASENP